MSDNHQNLDALADAVATSAKYRQVSPELVRNIGARELAKGHSFKAAVKATKNKLHQIAGAYQERRIDYEQSLGLLQTTDSPEAWRAGCRDIMRRHASTRERLPILDDFYRLILADITPPQTVLDVACGLNPLASAWMPLPDNVFYTAYDIYGDMMLFLREAMRLAQLSGRAEVRDVIHNPPAERVDLAFLLKSLPCLEQVEKGVSARLLDAIQARYLLISYPVSSLGGRSKGMVATYDAQFAALSAGRSWSIRRFLFDTELAFLVDTQCEQGDDDARS